MKSILSRVCFEVALIALSIMPAAALAAGEDLAAVIARSDIAIGQPNILPMQAMGLGNGHLGAAFWAADGLTLQLNRADTLPYRRSPGQVSFPDLKALTADRGFRGRVNLYDGTLDEAGGGVTLRAWVDRYSDRVIVDLGGLPAEKSQRIVLRLWEPRAPVASAETDIASLAETWRDDQLPGSSGRRFGSLAAVKAIGRDAHARIVDARAVELTATPNADGRLRVVIAAPASDGTRSAADVLRQALAPEINLERSVAWWHAFWSRANTIRAESSDGIARYAETLRTLYLFAAAAHNADGLPGSQAGIADLFSASNDDHFWDPAAFWFWNLRMQVGANLAAGLPELNASVFALYRNNLDAIRRWTHDHTAGRPGICVPETMRFNGNGVEYESDRFRPFAIVTHSCDLGWSPVANARTLSTGAEIGLWVWRTWLQTRDREFLAANYPLMAESARFLLAYQKPGNDGLLHTVPSNAHETQTDVSDPATDIAAIRSLYPATIAAATTLGRDAELIAQMKKGLAQTPPLPLMNPATHALALSSTNNASDHSVLAASYQSDAPYQNGENIGLEAVWPYALIGVDDPLFALARRTFAQRPFVYAATWSNDPIQAARLGLGADVAASIYQLVQLYQVYPNGMAALIPGPPNEFYIEQAGVVALALSEVLAVQDEDGLIRIGPAIPPGWTLSGRASLRDGATVDVEAVDGELSAFTLRGGNGTPLRFATPWQTRRVQISQNGKLLRTVTGDRFSFVPAKGSDYRFELADDKRTPSFKSETSPTVKALGRAAIGLGPPCCAPPLKYDIGSDKPAANNSH